MPQRSGGYSGKQRVNAGHIVQAGLDRGLDEGELSVAVMTAIGESSLINIDYGDEAGPDSRGLFQQRSSWGTEEQRMHPPTAAGFFYDALVEVPGYRDLAPTIAAHRTQRNADPFHYEQHWPTAARIVAAITGDDDFLKDLPPGGGDPPGGCLPPGTTPSGPSGSARPAGPRPRPGSPRTRCTCCGPATATCRTVLLPRCGFASCVTGCGSISAAEARASRTRTQKAWLRRRRASPVRLTGTRSPRFARGTTTCTPSPASSFGLPGG